jgi:hypothetical protein
LNEYAAALREIGQGCRDVEERWYVNAFKRGVPPYVRGHLIAAAPRTLDTAKQFAIEIGGKYGLGKDIVPEERPKTRREEDKMKQEVAEPPAVPTVMPSGSEPGTVMVPVFNPETGLVTLTPMPWSQLQGAIGKPAAATPIPPPTQHMHWDQQSSYQKPYKRNYQRGGRGFQGMKTEPQYNSGFQQNQQPVDAAASVMMAGRGQQQSGSHYGPPRQQYNQQYSQQPFNQRDGNDDRRNPLEEHTACFQCGEKGHWRNRCPQFLKEMIDKFAKRLEVAKGEWTQQRGGQSAASPGDQNQSRPGN